MNQNIQVLYRNELIKIVVSAFNSVLLISLLLFLFSFYFNELEKISIFFITGSSDFMFIILFTITLLGVLGLFLNAIEDDSINVNLLIAVMNICMLLTLLGVVL